MKQYQDFVSTISTETYEEIVKEIMESHEPASITKSIPEISFKISFKLLEMYHQWLHD